MLQGFPVLSLPVKIIFPCLILPELIHHYVNILLSLSGYIENGDLDGLQQYFDDKIFPTKHLIDHEDIFFFETSGNIHKIILHAKDRQIEFPGTMKELAAALGSGFVRCHRSFLVNKNNIQEIDEKNRIIHFTNGESCLMSTRMRKGF